MASIEYLRPLDYVPRSSWEGMIAELPSTGTWHHVIYQQGQKKPYYGNVDTSEVGYITIKEGGAERNIKVAPVYMQNEKGDLKRGVSLSILTIQVFVAFVFAFGFPTIHSYHLPQEYQFALFAGVFLGGTATIAIAYYIIRLALYPLYLIYRSAKEIKEGKAWGETLWRAGKDLVQEPFLAVAKILRAPIYGMLHTIGNIYTICSPLNGRKFVAKAEQGFNRHIKNGIAVAGCWQMDEQGELNDVFYVQACFQPSLHTFAELDENNKIIKIIETTDYNKYKLLSHIQADTCLPGCEGTPALSQS